MKSDINKTASEAIRDLFQQQQNIINAYSINPLSSVAVSMVASTAFSKVTNVAIPKNYFNPTMLGLSSYFNYAKNNSKRFNPISSVLGLSNLEILLSQIPKESFSTTFQNIFSPALQIQKSLSSLYSTKSAFANYSNLYANAAFWGQFKELQNVISEFPKSMTSASFDTDYESDEDLYINEVISETSVITQNIEKTKIVSFEDFEQLKSKIDAIYSLLISSQKIKHGKLLTFIIFLLFTIEPLLNDIIQQVQHYQDTQTNVSHEDFKELSNKVQQSMDEMRKYIVKYEYRYADHTCFLKPKCDMKSKTIYRIKPGDNFMVLRVNKRWLLILIEDRTDGSQITGWVLKKYTQKSLQEK
ncbi:MAG: hypothetical protein JXR27_00955 [Paludibacteraceae bacterium]|nr:hypothetical protein [Paludibacteraceae bacterium]